MNSVVDQAELSLTRQPNQVEIPIEMIRAKKTAGSAITLACDTSGLEDKEIFMPLGIDKGYFSNIKSGNATLQADLIHNFCQVVGNRIYPEWLAYQVGCTLVEIETETQRLLRIEQEKRKEAEKENELLRKLLTGRGV